MFRDITFGDHIIYITHNLGDWSENLRSSDTKSLLSAIPTPNPIIEKKRVPIEYDYASSGIDYNVGCAHLLKGTHFVRCTDAELNKWV